MSISNITTPLKKIAEYTASSEYLNLDSQTKRAYYLLDTAQLSKEEILEQAEITPTSIQIAQNNLNLGRHTRKVGRSTILNDAEKEEICAFSLDSVDQEIKNKFTISWVDHFIDRHTEFRFYQGHVVDCQRYDAST
ncbi:MAG: hypothetical protein EZS28_028019 [Streblomastix strix]|uniref:Uncharacterized protein n=1 Tax=Streblomastix strix TaxID=222440 RepID=A0A5J4V329_9EUKA|nr:MAG: hypothetical protein EZS28_028019 [Streblomastix strix]